MPAAQPPSDAVGARVADEPGGGVPVADVIGVHAVAPTTDVKPAEQAVQVILPAVAAYVP